MTSVRDSTPPAPDDRPKLMESRVATLRARRQVAYLMLLTLITGLIGTGVCIWYTNRTAVATEHKAREDVQRWCQLLNSLDQRYQKIVPPPANSSADVKKQYQDALVFKGQIHDLVTGYDCDKVK